jgi:3-oxoacyl-[acyl-carrier-protein] synthase II
VLSFSSAHEPAHDRQLSGAAIRQVITDTLSRANLTPADLAHVNAHGLSTINDDRYEAAAIGAALGDVPAIALKSFFGHAGGGGGALEMAASLIGIGEGVNPFTLNYETPDPACPVNVVQGEPQRADRRAVIKISSSRLGPAAAIIFAVE